MKAIIEFDPNGSKFDVKFEDVPVTASGEWSYYAYWLLRMKALSYFLADDDNAQLFAGMTDIKGCLRKHVEDTVKKLTIKYNETK